MNQIQCQFRTERLAMFRRFGRCHIHGNADLSRGSEIALEGDDIRWGGIIEEVGVQLCKLTIVEENKRKLPAERRLKPRRWSVAALSPIRLPGCNQVRAVRSYLPKCLGQMHKDRLQPGAVDRQSAVPIRDRNFQAIHVGRRNWPSR